MAQRFKIDGNFTQSSVGTFNLNADACPADFEIRPILHYDIASGNVCYEYDDRICFEYTFGFNAQQNRGWSSNPSSPSYSPDVNSFSVLATAGKGIISFLQSGSDPDLPTTPIRSVTNDLSKTFSILINTQSVAGKDLNTYITQNSVSGSIILSSATEQVEFRYSSQTAPATPNTWKDQVLLGTNQLTSSVSTLNAIVSTDDTPFANGDKICVEVRPLGNTPSLQEVMEVGNSTTLTMTSSNEVTVYGTSNDASIILNDVVIERSGTDRLTITNDSNNGAELVALGKGGTNGASLSVAAGGATGDYPHLQFTPTDSTFGDSAGEFMGLIGWYPYNTANGSSVYIAGVTTEDQRDDNKNGGLLRFAATKAGTTTRTTLLDLNADEGAVFYTNITASGFISASSGHITGDLTVEGTGSFKVLQTIYETASIIYSSGSTKFGDTFDDTHIFTGSLYITSSNISASISASSYLHASASDANGNYNNVVTYDTATGRFYYTGSYGSGGGDQTLQETMEFGSTTNIAITSSAGVMLSGSGIITASLLRLTNETSNTLQFNEFSFDNNDYRIARLLFDDQVGSAFRVQDGAIEIKSNPGTTTNHLMFGRGATHATQGESIGDVRWGTFGSSNVGSILARATEDQGGSNKGTKLEFRVSAAGDSAPHKILELVYESGSIFDSDVSASGYLYASASDANGSYDNVVVYDTTTGRFYYTGSYNQDIPSLQEVMEVGSSTSIAISSSADVALSGSGDIVITNISASNNITASNDIFARQIQIGTRFSASDASNNNGDLIIHKKINSSSKISFPTYLDSDYNDPGFIEHYNNEDEGVMRFAVADNSDGLDDDRFEFGNSNNQQWVVFNVNDAGGPGIITSGAIEAATTITAGTNVIAKNNVSASNEVRGSEVYANDFYAGMGTTNGQIHIRSGSDTQVIIEPIPTISEPGIRFDRPASQDTLVYRVQTGNDGGIFVQGTGTYKGVISVGPESTNTIGDGEYFGSYEFNRDSTSFNINNGAGAIRAKQHGSSAVHSSSLEFFANSSVGSSLNKIFSISTFDGAVFDYDVTVNADISASGEISGSEIYSDDFYVGADDANGTIHFYSGSEEQVYFKSILTPSLSGIEFFKPTSITKLRYHVNTGDDGAFYVKGTGSLKGIVSVGPGVVNSVNDGDYFGSFEFNGDQSIAYPNIGAGAIRAKRHGSDGNASSSMEFFTNGNLGSTVDKVFSISTFDGAVFDYDVTVNADISASGNVSATNVSASNNVRAEEDVIAGDDLYARGGRVYGTNDNTYIEILDKRVQFRTNGALYTAISNDTNDEGRKFTINPSTTSNGIDFNFYTSGSQSSTNYFNGTSTENPFFELSYLDRRVVIGQSSSKAPVADDDHTLIVSGNVDIVANSIGQSGSLTAQIIELENTQLQGVEVSPLSDLPTDLFTFATGSYTGVICDYVLSDSSNGYGRTGHFLIHHVSDTTVYSDTSTTDIGSDPIPPSLVATEANGYVTASLTFGNSYTFKSLNKLM